MAISGKGVKKMLLLGLINRSKLKKYVLEKAHEKYRNVPAYMPTRVSGEFFEKAEDGLRLWVMKFLDQRPSKGRTL